MSDRDEWQPIDSDDLTAVPLERLRSEVASLDEELRMMKEQLRDDANGTFPRGSDWRHRAVFRRDRLREEKRFLAAELDRRLQPARDQKKAKRQEAAMAQARAAEARRLATYSTVFMRTARAMLPPEMLAAVEVEAKRNLPPPPKGDGE